MQLSPFPYQSLLQFYHSHGRIHLPWRKFHTENVWIRGYHVWLSEILLQQTQANRVIPFYERILERFPDIIHLANATYEEFFPYYSGLGYYSRARNLLAAAKIITTKYKGIFPKTTEELRELPWVGPYTAEAIRAFVYDIPTLSFDTNLEKIFARYYHGSRHLKLSNEEKIIILKDFVQSGFSSRDINAAFMDFGSLVSINSKALVDFEFFKELHGKFGETRGILEEGKVKTHNIFPTKDAKHMVFLFSHDGQKTYSETSKYEPFILAANPDVEGREYIKIWFRTNYKIEVSVRPPFKKEFREDVPFLLYNARIQTGLLDWFYGHSKEIAKLWQQSHLPK